MRIVVLASGDGSNFQVIAEAIAAGRIQGQLVGLICNRKQARVVERAQTLGVRTEVIDHQDHPDRNSFEQTMLAVLQRWQPDLIVLAGFMRVLSASFVQRFSGQIINIHPSLLPAYKGLNTHQHVLNAGDRLHGCSVHFVIAALDAGTVIAQSLLEVRPQDTVDSLAQRVHQLEHELYPRIIGWIAAGRVALLGNQVYLDGYPRTRPVRFADFL